MDDYLEEFILFDALSVSEDGYCPNGKIGILQGLTETEVICDICDKVYPEPTED